MIDEANIGDCFVSTKEVLISAEDDLWLKNSPCAEYGEIFVVVGLKDPKDPNVEISFVCSKGLLVWRGHWAPWEEYFRRIDE